MTTKNTTAASQTGSPAALTAEEIEAMTEERLDAEHRAAAMRFYALHQQWRQVHEIPEPEDQALQELDRHTPDQAEFEDAEQAASVIHEAKLQCPSDFPGAVFTAAEAMQVYDNGYHLGQALTAGEIVHFCMREHIIPAENMGKFFSVIGRVLPNE